MSCEGATFVAFSHSVEVIVTKEEWTIFPNPEGTGTASGLNSQDIQGHPFIFPCLIFQNLRFFLLVPYFCITYLTWRCIKMCLELFDSDK